MDATALGMLRLTLPEVPGSLKDSRGNEPEIRRPEVNGQVGEKDADAEGDDQLGQHRPFHHFAHDKAVDKHPHQEKQKKTDRDGKEGVETIHR